MPTEAAPKSKLGVLGIRAEGLETMASTLLDVLVTEVAKTKRYEVISADEIQAMLGLERMKDAVGCDDVSCMADIGGALGLKLMISGSVAKMGEAYIVNLQLINVVYGTAENRVSMQWTGPVVELVSLLGAAAQDLVTPSCAKTEPTEKHKPIRRVVRKMGSAMVCLDPCPCESLGTVGKAT